MQVANGHIIVDSIIMRSQFTIHLKEIHGVEVSWTLLAVLLLGQFS